jgi:predicted amidohydrolase YtcJ
MNSAAIDQLGITADSLSGHGESSKQVDVEAGHFWEGGFMNLVLPSVAPFLVSRERIERGLHQMVAYLRQNGVTAFNEPGVFWEVEPWDLYDHILGAENAPFLSTFMVDGRGQSAKGIHGEDALADALAQVARAPEGKVMMLDGHVKLFADGAIISQLMQMKDPYLDADGNPDPDHRGEWLMTPEEYRQAFRTYWDAGWQIHTHVNGDLGLDLVLDTLEGCLLTNPRAGHRTTVVHFANSTEEQVERIARLGAIVSANPYYPVGFADKYSEVGLGAERADAMVRARSTIERHIPFSLHSDLPMAPAEPLKLASFAVNRTTQSGRVAGPEQRISVMDALRGVTIEAAYSWRRENDLGTIAPGKLATFTVLAQDPFEIDPSDLGRIPVVGVVYEGEWNPVPTPAADRTSASLSVVLPGHGTVGDAEEHDHAGHSCSCKVARLLVEAYDELHRQHGPDRSAA